MTTTVPFDPSLYTRAPTITLASGIVLAQTLVVACPDIMPAPVKKAVAHLLKVSNGAQQAWAERQRESGFVPDEGTRTLDQEADGSWSGLRARLLAYAELPVALFPKARRAQEIVDTLFGDAGLGFLRDNYILQWSTMNVLLKRIDAEGLAADIDKLAGPEFLQHVRNVHPRYEAMVQSTLQRDASQQNLKEQVRLIQRAVVAYATRVCATVEDDDESTVETARTALAAIEKMRLIASNRRASNAGVDTAAPTAEPEVAQAQAQAVNL
jgi:hypothetical protein